MNEDGLDWIEYNPGTKVAAFSYRRGASFDTQELLAYAAVMSEGRAKRVWVYIGRKRIHSFLWSNNRWVDIAD